MHILRFVQLALLLASPLVGVQLAVCTVSLLLVFMTVCVQLAICADSTVVSVTVGGRAACSLYSFHYRYPKSTWTHVFTDGSAESAVRYGGSGAYIRRQDGTTSSLSIQAGDLRSNYRAELHALKASTELLIEEYCRQHSLSALQSLTNCPTDLPTQQLHNSFCALSNNNKVVLQRVPAHVGITRNARGCRQTGKGSSKNSLNPTSPPHTKRSRFF